MFRTAPKRHNWTIGYPPPGRPFLSTVSPPSWRSKGRCHPDFSCEAPIWPRGGGAGMHSFRTPTTPPPDSLAGYWSHLSPLTVNPPLSLLGPTWSGPGCKGIAENRMGGEDGGAGIDPPPPLPPFAWGWGVEHIQAFYPSMASGAPL